VHCYRDYTTSRSIIVFTQLVGLFYCSVQRKILESIIIVCCARNIHGSVNASARATLRSFSLSLSLPLSSVCRHCRQTRAQIARYAYSTNRDITSSVCVRENSLIINAEFQRNATRIGLPQAAATLISRPPPVCHPPFKAGIRAVPRR